MAAENRSDDGTFEVLAVQLWRRIDRGVPGPELSVAEAAAALGVSTDTVRRRIRTGSLKAEKDVRGQYRIALQVENAPETLAGATAGGSEEAAQLRKELEGTRAQLEATRRHSEGLVRELSAAMRAVADTQAELQALWRQLNLGPLSAQVFDLQRPEESHERNQGADRIQAMILDARARFRRRRHPWPLAG